MSTPANMALARDKGIAGDRSRERPIQTSGDDQQTRQQERGHRDSEAAMRQAGPHRSAAPGVDQTILTGCRQRRLRTMLSRPLRDA